MDFYPSEFSPDARDRIEREKIQAYRDLLPSSVYDFKEQDLALRCIMRIFLAFAKEACALRKESGWTIERIESESEEFRRRLTVMVVFDKFPGLDRSWFSNGFIEPAVERRFKKSEEWMEYQDLLLETRRDDRGRIPIEAPGRADTEILRSDAEIRTRASIEAREHTIGVNIDRLRKECGWSFDQLADAVGIDKKSILGHVNEGVKPRPKTMKEYAQAFTKALNRSVTVADLEVKFIPAR